MGKILPSGMRVDSRSILSHINIFSMPLYLALKGEMLDFCKFTVYI